MLDLGPSDLGWFWFWMLKQDKAMLTAKEARTGTEEVLLWLLLSTLKLRDSEQAASEVSKNKCLPFWTNLLPYEDVIYPRSTRTWLQKRPTSGFRKYHVTQVANQSIKSYVAAIGPRMCPWSLPLIRNNETPFLEVWENPTARSSLPYNMLWDNESLVLSPASRAWGCSRHLQSQSR